MSTSVRSSSKILLGDAMLFDKIGSEHKIKSHLVEFLLKLNEFEIAIVCDDSGSMMTPVDGTEHTRWDELCEIVKKILGIAIMFDKSGVDLYFLNEEEEYLNVKDPAFVEKIFSKTPSGCTPLVPVLKKLFQSPKARAGKDKKLLVFIATDGKPTDENDEESNDAVNELEHLLRDTRNINTTYVSFLLCTDEKECVGYLARWDRTMEHVDVTDDYDMEREKIRECQEDPNYPFTYDDYIVKALVGSIVPHIDRLNEPKRRTTMH